MHPQDRYNSETNIYQLYKLLFKLYCKNDFSKGDNDKDIKRNR